MELTLNCISASIDPANDQTVEINIEGVDAEEVLEQIGRDKAIEYFKIKEA